jgi:hypothetical protein
MAINEHLEEVRYEIAALEAEWSFADSLLKCSVLTDTGMSL